MTTGRHGPSGPGSRPGCGRGREPAAPQVKELRGASAPRRRRDLAGAVARRSGEEADAQPVDFGPRAAPRGAAGVARPAEGPPGGGSRRTSVRGGPSPGLEVARGSDNVLAAAARGLAHAARRTDTTGFEDGRRPAAPGSCVALRCGVCERGQADRRPKVRRQRPATRACFGTPAAAGPGRRGRKAGEWTPEPAARHFGAAPLAKEGRPSPEGEAVNSSHRAGLPARRRGDTVEAHRATGERRGPREALHSGAARAGGTGRNVVRGFVGSARRGERASAREPGAGSEPARSRDRRADPGKAVRHLGAAPSDRKAAPSPEGSAAQRPGDRGASAPESPWVNAVEVPRPASGRRPEPPTALRRGGGEGRGLDAAHRRGGRRRHVEGASALERRRRRSPRSQDRRTALGRSRGRASARRTGRQGWHVTGGLEPGCATCRTDFGPDGARRVRSRCWDRRGSRTEAGAAPAAAAFERGPGLPREVLGQRSPAERDASPGPAGGRPGTAGERRVAARPGTSVPGGAAARLPAGRGTVHVAGTGGFGHRRRPRGHGPPRKSRRVEARVVAVW